MTLRKYKLLTLLTCIGMFLVLIAGVLVTNTESQAGCGTDWPLCNGKFIPAYTLESMVEYSHRLISGGVGLLVGAAFLATVLWKPAKRQATVWFASSALFFTILQAALGAMAVVWPQSNAVLALHFGISLFAFTSTWLLYSSASRMAALEAPNAAGGRDKAVPSAGIGGGSRQQPAYQTIFGFGLGVLIYCYGVIYLGAYVRHTGTGGACSGWPLCNGEVIPPLDGAVGIAFLHRIAAVVMLILVAALALYVRRLAGPDSGLSRLAGWVFALLLLQILSGGLLAYTMGDRNVYVFTALLHTIIITALFSVICQLVLRARQWPGMSEQRSEV